MFPRKLRAQFGFRRGDNLARTRYAAVADIQRGVVNHGLPHCGAGTGRCHLPGGGAALACRRPHRSRGTTPTRHRGFQLPSLDRSAAKRFRGNVLDVAASAVAIWIDALPAVR
jgi:hypothetical protein